MASYGDELASGSLTPRAVTSEDCSGGLDIFAPGTAPQSAAKMGEKREMEPDAQDDIRWDKRARASTTAAEGHQAHPTFPRGGISGHYSAVRASSTTCQWNAANPPATFDLRNHASQIPPAGQPTTWPASIHTLNALPLGHRCQADAQQGRAREEDLAWLGAGSHGAQPTAHTWHSQNMMGSTSSAGPPFRLPLPSSGGGTDPSLGTHTNAGRELRHRPGRPTFDDHSPGSPQNLLRMVGLPLGAGEEDAAALAQAAAGSANSLPLSLDQVMHSERDRRRRHPAYSRSHAFGAQAEILHARSAAAPPGLSRSEAPCAAAYAGHLPAVACYGGRGNRSAAADSLLRSRVIVKVSLKVRAGGEAAAGGGRGEGGGAGREADEAGGLVTVHRRLAIPLEFDDERVPIKGCVCV